MKFYTETLGLSDTAFALLRDLVLEHTGLYFENGKCDLLADKLSPLVIEHGFNAFLDYYYYLKYDLAAQAEWPRVMDALSVQETYFWREPDQVCALVDMILPDLLAARPNGPLRIWSAACATGEEPLTLAMALNEKGWFERAAIEIVASDASPRAIERARQGTYRERSFRNLTPELRDKYFTPVEGAWQVRRDLHSRIEWRLANLIVPAETALLANAPVIFCRNVFIYFSGAAIGKTLQVLYRHMPAPGYLFVGTAESLLRTESRFELEEIGGAFVYVKRQV
jgi:chemotaxis protein methyltransferase CheR